MFPVQNGLICWLDAMDGKVGDTLLKDRTNYGHNLIVENFQQGYGFTGTSIKVKQSEPSTSNNNALYIANGGFKTSCKSFCICIERHNTNQYWYIFDGRELDGQGSSTNHCYKGKTGSSYDNSKTRRDGVLTYDNSNLDINKKTFLYFELREAELFTLSILMRYSKNENTEGEFYSLYAYNRALTEEEILQNMEYENNKISYVNKNNLPKIVDKLSNASNIKITGNKYGNRVQTVIDKIVEKADNVTKAIEQEVNNNSYSFKVGQGNNVDVSTDVKDGFGEIDVKGVTYQNLCKVRKITHNGRGDVNISVKPNTTYTVVCDITQDSTNSVACALFSSVFLDDYSNLNGDGLYNETVSGGKGTETKTNVTNGHSIYKYTTKSNEIYCHFRGGNSSTPNSITDNIMLIEGDHTNNPNLPSYFEGIVGVGDKSKNLLNINTENHAHGVDFKFEKNVLKSNGIGSVSILQSFKITGLTIGKTYTISCNSDDVRVNSNGTILSLTPTTYRSFVFNDTESIYFQIRQNLDCTKEIKFLLEEGTKATLYEPYYDGYKIEILSCGKNLYNIHNDITLTYGISKIEEGIITTNALVNYGTFGLVNSLHNINSRIFDKPTKIVKGKKYSISCKVRKVSGEGNLNYFAIFGFKKDKNSYISTGISYSNLSNINLSKDWLELKYSNVATDNFDTACPCFQVSNNVDNLILEVKDIQIEEADASTLYEPYVSDKTQILLDEPLMRVPNGVHDEITRDGKLIRRVGKIILKGNKWWTKYDNINYQEEGYSIYITQLPNKNYYKEDKINILGDNFASVKFRSGKGEYIYSDGWNQNVFIKIKDSRLTSSNVEGFKQWLSQNPTTVYYELAEPIVTELPAPCLRIFKDGHLTFNTLVAPESNHVVQLNKSGQIQNAIKESQSLDNRINVLENNYDNLMLSTISRLNDLELNYKLK